MVHDASSRDPSTVLALVNPSLWKQWQPSTTGLLPPMLTREKQLDWLATRSEHSPGMTSVSQMLLFLFSSSKVSDMYGVNAPLGRLDASDARVAVLTTATVLPYDTTKSVVDIHLRSDTWSGTSHPLTVMSICIPSSSSLSITRPSRMRFIVEVAGTTYPIAISHRCEQLCTTAGRSNELSVARAGVSGMLSTRRIGSILPVNISVLMLRCVTCTA